MNAKPPLLVNLDYRRPQCPKPRIRRTCCRSFAESSGAFFNFFFAGGPMGEPPSLAGTYEWPPPWATHMRSFPERAARCDHRQLRSATSTSARAARSSCVWIGFLHLAVVGIVRGSVGRPNAQERGPSGRQHHRQRGRDEIYAHV